MSTKGGMIMKIKLALLVAAVLVLASCSASQNPLSENSPVVDADMNGSSVVYDVNYNTMSADWPIYKNVTELTEAANVILLVSCKLNSLKNGKKIYAST